MDTSLLPLEAANELCDFYQFLLQKQRRTKRANKNSTDTSSYPLHGLPYQYDAPFEPVAAEEWETPYMIPHDNNLLTLQGQTIYHAQQN